MTLFDTEPPVSANLDSVLLGTQIVSLIVTGCVVWIAVADAAYFPVFLAITAGRAAGFAVLAWIWNATILAGLYFFFAGAIPGRLRGIPRTSTAAMWFAPVAILLIGQSPAAMLAVLILVVSATRTLHSEWWLTRVEPAGPGPAYNAASLFRHSDIPSSAFSRQLVSGLALAFALQSGAVAAMMHHPLLATGCFAVSAAFLTVFGTTAGVLPPARTGSLPRSIAGAILTVLLAAGLAVSGLARGPAYGPAAAAAAHSRGSPGFISLARSLLHRFLYGDRLRAAPRSAGMPDYPGAPMADFEAAGARVKTGPNDFPGVILWPEVRAVTTLVAPVPPGVGFSAHSVRPLGIPFSGEYWMFRQPYSRPPRGSFLRRGSPVGLGFFTTDHVPLQMEARHKLDQPVDLRCCSKIQVAIWNADRYPGTVALELTLIGTGQWKRRSLLLGSAAVKSSPGVLPVYETLEFPVPANLTMEQFDEFRVVFHRHHSRTDRSARIEIDRFVLVPAGR